MLKTLAIEGYRSIRHLVLPLDSLTVVTGANGTGKSSLYRSLRLLSAVASDGAIRALAGEGGFGQALWAGPENGARAGFPTQGTVRNGPVSLRLGVGADANGFGYAIDFGLPIPSHTMFGGDPEIKAESIWNGAVLRAGSLLCERRGASSRIRGGDGWQRLPLVLAPWESVISEHGDSENAPEILELRRQLRDWRFYDAVRTDADAPARHAAIGTRTPILPSDGTGLAAALQTVREQGDGAELDAVIDRGFPGSRLEISEVGGRFTLALRQPGLLRPLDASELSDGTLRYLVWVAALLSIRPAGLMALNEPETSLHPSMLAPLAELLVAASTRTQVIVVSHSAALIEALGRARAQVHVLEKVDGQTRIQGQGALDEPHWTWPSR